MKSVVDRLKPQARTEGLVIQELADEVLVYDLDADKAHCLNKTAAIVWQHCDGKTGVEEISRRLAAETGVPADAELVWLALDQLGKARLLPERLSRADASQSMTRREMMKRLGIGASVALPIVTSIVAPMVVEAATCSHAGGSCGTSAQCCPGSCVCSPGGVCVGTC